MNRRGFGTVYQRGSMWWIQYWFRGKQHNESSGSKLRSDAVKLLRRRMAEMGQGRLQGPDLERTTFDDLTQIIVKEYRVNGRRSLVRMQTALKALRAFFDLSLARDISLDRLTAYADDRLDAHVSHASIRYELAVLRRAFRLAQRAGKAICPPFPTIEVHNTRTGFFERDAFHAVRAHLSDPIQAVVTFAYFTGWRVLSEVLTLQWRQIDFHAGVIRLDPGTTKNDDGRTFPFAILPELADVLRQQRELTTALEHNTHTIIPWIFHRNGQRIKDFRKGWLNACKAAGVPGMIPHDFRRTAVRNLERAGVSRSAAKKLTGHKTDSVYNRYAIVSEADLSEGVKKLAGLHATDGKTNQRSLAVQ